jgi:hypothetical protein
MYIGLWGLNNIRGVPVARLTTTDVGDARLYVLERQRERERERELDELLYGKVRWKY